MTTSGVGLVVGAGIYVLIGSAAAEAGNGVWLAFIVAAVMSGLTALSYAEMASMFPSASAEYEFTRRAFNEFAGFMAGWAMLVAYIIAAAAVSIGFGHYLNHFVDVDSRLAAIGILVVLTALVIAGIERSIWLSVALVCLQVAGLVLVIVAGAPHIGQRDLLEGASVSGVFGAAALVFFAFIGFDDIITLSDETKDPRRTMPRALLLTLGISTVLYLLVGISAVSLVGADALAVSNRPLASIVAHDWGDAGADIIAVIALAATVNTTLLLLTAASRLIYGIAERGSLPRALAAVGEHGRAPYKAAGIVLAASSLFALIGKIDVVAAATDLAVFMTFIAVNSSVIYLRFRRPEWPRGFRTPWTIGRLPVLPIFAMVTVITLAAFSKLEAWLICVALMALGTCLWLAFNRAKAGRA